MTEPEAPIRVAVCEDDADYRDILLYGLTKLGLRAYGVPSSEALDCLLAERDVDLVVLDIGLPGEDGFSAAQRLRHERPHLGIVMLTARVLVDDRIRGLNQGADLYFVKPVDLGELAAALASLHRRIAPIKTKPARPWRLSKGRSVLETPDGLTVALTDPELQLLERLLATPGTTVERAELLLALGWAPDDKADHRLATVISRLRTKVASATPAFILPLRARHGTGYAFLVDEEPAP
jgi:DNA-binding response OmpR family regulator